MAKIYSTAVQLLALRGMCSRNVKVSGHMLSHLDDSHFHGEECVEAYEAIHSYLEAKGSPPTYKLLCESVQVSKSTRDLLKTVSGYPHDLNESSQVVDRLNEYRKTRIAMATCMATFELLKGTKVSVEKVISTMQDGLAAMQVNKSVEEQIRHIGREENNADEDIKALIFGTDDDHFIPTGWKTFDHVNAGMPRGGLVIIGGSSGAGKSHVITQLSKTQAMMGYKVSVVPLEMTRSEMQARLLANVAQYDSLRINRRIMTSDEKEMLWKKYRRFKRKVTEAGGCLTSYNPTTDVSLEETFAALHSFGSDVVYIDYIGLLKGADSEDQWRQLGRIARAAKVYAGNHNKVVVLAAQVDDDGKVRYSRTIKEHASLGFSFVATKESRDAGYLNMEMIKGRNQQLMNFTLSVDYPTSTVKDLDPSAEDTADAGAASSSDAPRTRKKAKAAEGENFMPE